MLGLSKSLAGAQKRPSLGDLPIRDALQLLEASLIPLQSVSAAVFTTWIRGGAVKAASTTTANSGSFPDPHTMLRQPRPHC